MINVYVVIDIGSESCKCAVTVVGVFSTKKEAMREMNNQEVYSDHNFYIEIFELDKHEITPQSE